MSAVKRLALIFWLLFTAAPVWAQDVRPMCTTDRTINCYTQTVHPDAVGGGGGSGSFTGAVYGPDNVGAAPTKPPILNGFKDASGNVREVAPVTPLPAQLFGTLPPFATPPTVNQGAPQTSYASAWTTLSIILDSSGVPNPVGPNNPVPISGPITCSNCSTTTVNGATFDGTLGSFAAYPDGGWVANGALSLTPGKAYTRPMTPEGGNYSTSVPSVSPLVGFTPYSSTAAQTFQSLKASAGNFYSLYVTNFSTVAGYAVIGQTAATTAPASGTAIPKSECVPLPASGTTGLYQLAIPDVVPTGLAIYVSTSCYTYTPSTITADFHVQFK